MHCLGMMWKPKICNKDCVYVNEFTIMAESLHKVILKTSAPNGIISSCGGRIKTTHQMAEGMRLKRVNKWPKCMKAT